MDIEIAFGSLQVLVDKFGTSFSKGALDTIRKKYAEAVEQPLTGNKSEPQADICPRCGSKLWKSLEGTMYCENKACDYSD